MDRAVPYIPRLDSFRAIAAFAVIWCHYFDPMLPLAWRNYAVGMAGVIFFFVLSGYLITSVILADGGLPSSERLRRFYVRRTFRIFPLYYFALALGLALGIRGFWTSQPWSALYLVDACVILPSCDVTKLGYTAHFWTLGVEEKFYLLWPLVVIFASWRWAIAFTLLLAAAVYGFLIGTFGPYWLPPVERLSRLWEWAPAAVVPAICAGALLAFAGKAGLLERTERMLRWLMPLTISMTLFLSSTVASTAALLHPALYWVPAPLGEVLVMSWLIARAALDGPSGSSWGGRWLPALGVISYGIYVYHQPIRSFIDIYDPTWTLITPRVIGVAATIGVAWLSYYCMELPLRRLGRRIASRPHAVTRAEHCGRA
jgi:peptidoglycan/LPS O-acetylase OafA/YrhL